MIISPGVFFPRCFVCFSPSFCVSSAQLKRQPVFFVFYGEPYGAVSLCELMLLENLQEFIPFITFFPTNKGRSSSWKSALLNQALHQCGGSGRFVALRNRRFLHINSRWLREKVRNWEVLPWR